MSVAPKGWCPTLAAPMATGDGLLVRVRPPGAVLAAAAARALASAAARWGNGAIEATGRAGLQIRGLSAPGLAPFAACMVACGLADPDPSRDRHGVIATPLAGDDPTAHPQSGAVAQALTDALAADRRLDALPAKFGFLVDGGGALGLAGVSADIRIALDGARARIGLDGGRRAADTPVGEAVAAALALAHAFLGLATAASRMRALVAAFGEDAVFAAAGLAACATLEPPPAPTAIGFLPYRDGGRGAFGVGLPFGSMSAAELAGLAALAEQFGDGTLRLSPWRALLLAGIAAADLPRLRADLAAGTLIAAPDDPRLAVAACPGAPACASATVATRALAAVLAAPGRPGLHVSGCAKGCAHPGPAALTLVGRDGRFDLVRDGRAGDPPSRTGLTASEALTVLTSA